MHVASAANCFVPAGFCTLSTQAVTYCFGKSIAGKQENQAPKRVNGTLKKVWKRMDQPSVEWVNLEKPRFNLEAAASETNATNV